METIFLRSFEKDLAKIQKQDLLDSIADVIEAVENADSLYDLPHVKKLSGFKNAFRIRVGDFRIGIFWEDNVVEFARVVHRKDIYKLFP